MAAPILTSIGAFVWQFVCKAYEISSKTILCFCVNLSDYIILMQQFML